jgi:MoaA/NifB/PqqE/SkfB family radical SAM enzyme
VNYLSQTRNKIKTMAQAAQRSGVAALTRSLKRKSNEQVIGEDAIKSVIVNKNYEGSESDLRQMVVNRVRPELVYLLLTSRCNLRCVYCDISGKYTDQSSHIDMDRAVVSKIINMLKDSPIKDVHLSGGEVTVRSDWKEIVTELVDNNFRVSIIENFAKLMSDEELRFFSKFTDMAVSIDTPDATLLKAIRPKTQLENIVYNIIKLKSICASEGLRAPGFNVNCTLGNPNLHTLPALVAFVKNLGITSLFVTDVIEYEKSRHEFNSILNFDVYSREQCLEIIAEAQSMARRLSVNLHMDKALTDALSGEVTNLPSGATRECQEPWNRLLFMPNGDIYPCCNPYPPIANVRDVNSLDEAFFSEKNIQCRTELVTGNLRPECVACGRKAAISTDEFLLKAKNRYIC